MHKSVGPVEIHPQVLKELADEVAKPLSTMFERSRQSGEVPTDLKNITLIFKKGEKKKRKEDPGTTGQSVSPLCLARSRSRSF